MSLTLYGIPNCGTVKKAARWLDERGVEHKFVDFRAHPVGRSTVDAWVAALGAKALRNTSGGSYRALGEDKQTWSDAQWAEAFTADPMLIKRPLIERDGTAIKAGFRGKDDEIAALLLD